MIQGWIKNKKGVVLLLSLFILSSILIITLGAASIVLAGIKMNRLTGYSSIAFYASEAGLERVLWEARQNGNPAAIPETALANGSLYAVTYTLDAGNTIFKSIGSFGGVKRSVEATY